jgi:hypothetical protein
MVAAMKPYEETWVVDATGTQIRSADGYRIARVDELDVPPREFANAKLIAQAPAMARLLLHRMGDRYCEYCGVKVDRVTETGIVDPVYKGETLVLSDPGKHAPDCALVTVLRAAGVLE